VTTPSIPDEACSARSCPDCGGEVPVLAGFPDWCDACGWNVRAPAPPWRSGHPVDRAMAAIGRRSGDRLARELRAARELRSRWSAARLTAYAIAALVVLASAGLVAAGIAALAYGGLNPVTVLIGALLIGLGWLLRPRLGRLDHTHAVAAEAAPELHALVADVAAALGIRAPDVVALTPEFNAHWAVAGLRRRRALSIGTPLLAVLRGPALVALVAHEAGHERNGDARRGLLVGSAVDGLAALYDALVPDPHAHRIGDDLLDAAAPLARAFQRIVALPVLGVLTLEAQLLLRDSRRAEFVADARAAEVAGTAGVVALHERLLLRSTYKLTVQRVIQGGGGAAGLFAELRAAFDAVPPREHARRRAVARLEASRLDETHPPTGMRIGLLEDRPPCPGTVHIDQAREARLDAELAALSPALEAELLDRERGLLYSG
jgi:Zn-dependent protease with chaperone function